MLLGYVLVFYYYLFELTIVDFEKQIISIDKITTFEFFFLNRAKNRNELFWGFVIYWYGKVWVVSGPRNYDHNYKIT